MPLRCRIMTRHEKRSDPSGRSGPTACWKMGVSRFAEALARPPAAAEREKERDLEIRGASLCAGERDLGLGERRLRLKDVEKTDLPRIEARVRETGRIARVPSRVGQRFDALTFLRVAGQRAFDLAQRVEPRAVESSERRV